MHHLLLAAAFTSTAAAVSYEISDYIRAASNTPVARASSTTEPCAEVSSLLSTNATKIPADTALACLRSVPLDSKNYASQLEGISAFVQFQTTLAYLKDPPHGYLYPGVDILGGLAAIGDLLQANNYTNDYDVQNDIALLMGSAYDEHLNYDADITQVFVFQRNFSLLSLSSDGISLPEIYAGADIRTLINHTSANYTASPITHINGIEVESFLNSLATQTAAAQDPDTNYNSLFPVLPLIANKQSTPINGGWAEVKVYQGTDTVVTFQNGTVLHVDTFASTAQDFTDVTDGESFFRKFCTNGLTAQLNQSQTPTSSVTASVTPSVSATQTSLQTEVPYSSAPAETLVAAPTTYPSPAVIADDYSVGGYFPHDESDLAVLTVPTFEPTNGATQFQDVVRQFLATASALGKTKLMIDVRGNGGGQVFLGFDMFKQLFPSVEPYGASNFRAFPFFDDVGKIISGYYSNISASDITDPTTFCNNAFGTWFNVRQDLTDMLTAFSSWSDFYGPHVYHGDNFTSLTRYNLSDYYSSCPIVVSGYQNLTGINPVQPFRSEDIVILSDGTCASTCAVFSEFMKTQANVKTVAIGGRKQYGPMQGVGGVKGSNVAPYDAIAAYIQEARTNDSTPEQQTSFNQAYASQIAAAPSALARITKSASARVNIRNNIRQNDTSVTPLQFVYEAADCRIFYTAPMMLDQTKVWAATYKAFWGNGTCVQGSTGQPSSLSGKNLTSGINSYPPTGANNTFGANVSSSYPTDLASHRNVTTSSSSPTTSSTPSSSTPSYKNASSGLQISGGLALMIAAVLGVAAFL